MSLITDFRTAGRGKFKFGGQVGETDYSTAHTGSDPNYLGRPLWRAMLSSDASSGMWATDCGRTQVPGFLVHLVLINILHYPIHCQQTTDKCTAEAPALKKVIITKEINNNILNATLHLGVDKSSFF
jgi:hypothetical protein